MRIDPLNMCRPQDFPYEKCDISSENGNGESGPLENDEILTKEDLPRHTNKLIQSISPPEKHVVFNGNRSNGADGSVNGRADENDVQKGICIWVTSWTCRHCIHIRFSSPANFI